MSNCRSEASPSSLAQNWATAKGNLVREVETLTNLREARRDLDNRIDHTGRRVGEYTVKERVARELLMAEVWRETDVAPPAVHRCTAEDVGVASAQEVGQGIKGPEGSDS